jgi:putative transposase
MKRARFNEEQIISVLKEAEWGEGHRAVSAARDLGRHVLYLAEYGGLEVSEMRRLRQLEEENRRLKSIVPIRHWIFGRSRTYWQKTVTARGEASKECAPSRSTFLLLCVASILITTARS